jgi:hypothetical protein
MLCGPCELAESAIRRSLIYVRIVLAGVAVPLTAILLIAAVATGYAFELAFAIHGAPEQMRIARFAQDIGRSWWTVSQIALTVPSAMWASRSVGDHWQGVLVGIVVAAIQFAMSPRLNVQTFVVVALIIAAGWIGGALPGLIRHQRTL